MSQEWLLRLADGRAGLGQDDHDQLAHEEVLYGDPRHDVVHILVDDNPAIIPGFVYKPLYIFIIIFKVYITLLYFLFNFTSYFYFSFLSYRA